MLLYQAVSVMLLNLFQDALQFRLGQRYGLHDREHDVVAQDVFRRLILKPGNVVSPEHQLREHLQSELRVALSRPGHDL